MNQTIEVWSPHVPSLEVKYHFSKADFIKICCLIHCWDRQKALMHQKIISKTIIA